MSRNRASAKAAGSRFERVVADYLAEHVDDRIDRRAKTGAKDKGDIGGVRLLGDFDNPRPDGDRVTVECKDTAKPSLGAWAAEAEAERLNDIDRALRPALAGVVIHKRHGKGDPADQWVTCTLRDFAALLSGVRPDDSTTKEGTP